MPDAEDPSLFLSQQYCCVEFTGSNDAEAASDPTLSLKQEPLLQMQSCRKRMPFCCGNNGVCLAVFMRISNPDLLIRI
jgi:hypothetical protein